jgi:hypothetical protein
LHAAKTLAFALALPLCTALAPAQAAGSADPTTLEQVTAPMPGTQVRVACETAMWPTLRQVSRYTGRNEEAAAPLRARILSEGRHACAQGSTHVLVVFNPSAGAGEPVAVR